MHELLGKVALVTGGSRGIGAAIAKALSEKGADVAITYVNSRERASAVTAAIEASGRRGLAIQADAADVAAARAAVDETVRVLGRLDILVNNAGIFAASPPEKVTLEEIDAMLAIHVKSVFVASQAALNHMGEGGRIISIGSCLAHHVPGPGLTLYSMTKAALGGFARGLARDVGKRGITVNNIDPGPTDTDMNPADSDRADASRKLIALGHYGNAEDIAATVTHLAGPGGRFITGASIAVDGGINA